MGQALLTPWEVNSEGMQILKDVTPELRCSMSFFKASKAKPKSISCAAHDFPTIPDTVLLTANTTASINWVSLWVTAVEAHRRQNWHYGNTCKMFHVITLTKPVGHKVFNGATEDTSKTNTASDCRSVRLSVCLFVCLSAVCFDLYPAVDHCVSPCLSLSLCHTLSSHPFFSL